MFVGWFPCVFWGAIGGGDIWPGVLGSYSPNLTETSGPLASPKQNHLQEEPSGVGDRTDLSKHALKIEGCQPGHALESPGCIFKISESCLLHI